MTLKQAVEDPGSSLRQFLDMQLPNTKAARGLWKADASPIADVTPAVTIATPTGGTKKYPYDEVGHAVSLRLTLLFSPDVPTPAVPPVRHPVTGEHWSAAVEAHAELLTLIPAAAGFAKLSDAYERRLAQLTYVAGLFDQYTRIGVYPGLPLLDVPAGAPLDVLLATLVHPACVDDIVALAALARTALQPLQSATPVAVGPVFEGSGDLGGADGDMLVGRTLVELKTRGKLELQQRHLHQLVSYALLDYDDEYGIRELAWYSARHGCLVRLSLDRVLNAMADGTADVSGLRQDLQAHLQGDAGR